jgi:Protein phosphatase 2C
MISPGHHHSDHNEASANSAAAATPTASAASAAAPAAAARTFGAVAFVTRDHTPYDAAEVERITAAGGQVVCKLGKTRVRAADWNLAISRSMGGTSWQQAGVIPTPDVTRYCYIYIYICMCMSLMIV